MLSVHRERQSEMRCNAQSVGSAEPLYHHLHSLQDPGGWPGKTVGVRPKNTVSSLSSVHREIPYRTGVALFTSIVGKARVLIDPAPGDWSGLRILGEIIF